MKPVKLSRASMLCYSKSVAFWVWGWFWCCLRVSPLRLQWLNDMMFNTESMFLGQFVVCASELMPQTSATDVLCSMFRGIRSSSGPVCCQILLQRKRERGEILLQNQRLPTSKLNLCINSSKTQILWPLVFLMFPFVLVLTQYFTDSTSIINHNTVTVCNINLYHTD